MLGLLAGPVALIAFASFAVAMTADGVLKESWQRDLGRASEGTGTCGGQEEAPASREAKWPGPTGCR
jgi:hypothetical protein